MANTMIGIAEEDAVFIEYKRLMALGYRALENYPRIAAEYFSKAKAVAGNPVEKDAEVNIAIDEALALV